MYEWEMDLGAKVLPNGTSFKVWAPKCSSVDVVIIENGYKFFVDIINAVSYNKNSIIKERAQKCLCIKDLRTFFSRLWRCFFPERGPVGRMWAKRNRKESFLKARAPKPPKSTRKRRGTPFTIMAGACSSACCI